VDGEGSSTWKYVGIGCGILALIAACSLGVCFACAGVGIGAGIAATEEPANATRSFFGHVRAGQIELAHAETSSRFQASHSVEQLRAGLAAMPELAASTDQTISQRNVQAGGSATMGGTLEGPSGRTSFTATLVQEGGVWRIDGLTVAGRGL
jgi:hypothetical protein